MAIFCRRIEGVGIATSRPHAALTSRCCLELDDQLGWDPAAVLDLKALRLGPFADIGSVRIRSRTSATAPTAWTPSSRADLTPGCDVQRQDLPQILGVGGIQIDLIGDAVQAEANRSLRFTAVKVIGEECLYPLRHRCSISGKPEGQASRSWDLAGHRLDVHSMVLYTYGVVMAGLYLAAKATNSPSLRSAVCLRPELREHDPLTFLCR
jgi:hypothetical protein